jgi:hypothetical protein
MHRISAASDTPDFDLPAFEFSLADTANPLIVERIPSPESISCAQYLVECDVRDHNKKHLAHCTETNNRDAG